MTQYSYPSFTLTDVKDKTSIGNAFSLTIKSDTIKVDVPKNYPSIDYSQTKTLRVNTRIVVMKVLSKTVVEEEKSLSAGVMIIELAKDDTNGEIICLVSPNDKNKLIGTCTKALLYSRKLASSKIVIIPYILSPVLRMTENIIKDQQGKLDTCLKNPINITDLPSSEYIIPSVPGTYMYIMNSAKDSQLLDLPQFKLRRNNQQVVVPESIIRAYAINFYLSCFEALISSDTDALNSFTELLFEYAIDKSNLIPYTLPDNAPAAIRNDLTEEDIEVVRRAGVLFILSAFKPSVTKDSPPEQGSGWEQKRYKAYLASLGAAPNVDEIKDINEDIYEIYLFWSNHQELKFQVMRWLLFKVKSTSLLLTSLRKQVGMVSASHDMTMFMHCLRFAKATKTEAHLISEVIDESIAITKAEIKLKSDLEAFKQLHDITTDVDIIWYTTLLPRAPELDIQSYPTLAKAVYLEMSTNDAWKNFRINKSIIPKCSESRLIDRLKVPLAKTKVAASAGYTQQQLDFLTSAGYELPQTVQPAQFDPKAIEALKVALGLK